MQPVADPADMRPRPNVRYAAVPAEVRVRRKMWRPANMRSEMRCADVRRCGNVRSPAADADMGHATAADVRHTAADMRHTAADMRRTAPDVRSATAAEMRGATTAEMGGATTAEMGGATTAEMRGATTAARMRRSAAAMWGRNTWAAHQTCGENSGANSTCQLPCTHDTKSRG